MTQPLLRIDRRALEDLGGRLHWDGGLFDGVVYDINREQVSSARRIEGGVDVGAHEEPYIDVSGAVDRITLEHPELDGDLEVTPLHFGGELFNGLLYEVHGPYCLSCDVIRDGWTADSVEWNSQGLMTALKLSRPGVRGIAEWRRAGGLSSLQLDAEQGKTLRLGFDGEGRITNILIKGQVFDVDTSPLSAMPVAWPTRVEELQTRRGGESLVLTDVPFDIIAAPGFLDGTRELTLVRILDRPRQVLEIQKHIPALRRLSVHDDLGNLVESLRELRRRRPSLSVAYNHTEL